MASYVIPQRLVTRPQAPRLAWTPEREGLVFAYHGGHLKNLVNSRPIAAVNAAGLAATPAGWILSSVNSSSQYFTFPPLTATLPFTIAAWVIRMGSTLGLAFITSRDTGALNHVGTGLWLDFTANVWGGNYGDNTGTSTSARRSAVTSRTLTTGRLYHLVVVCRGATDWSLYEDGISYTPSYSGTGGAPVTGAVDGRIGSNNSAVYIDAQWLDIRVWNRALSDAEALALYGPATRWSLYAAPSLVMNVPASGTVGRLVNRGLLSGGLVGGRLVA